MAMPMIPDAPSPEQHPPILGCCSCTVVDFIHLIWGALDHDAEMHQVSQAESFTQAVHHSHAACMENQHAEHKLRVTGEGAHNP